MTEIVRPANEKSYEKLDTEMIVAVKKKEENQRLDTKKFGGLSMKKR